MTQLHENFACVKWDGKEYLVDVKHNERFKKITLGYLSSKAIRITLVLLGEGIPTTVKTVDFVDSDDNLHGHDVAALLYVSYKDLKDGKNEVRVFAASDDFIWCEEVGKATVTENPLLANKGQWGGKRHGAGRKVAGTKSVIFRLTETQHETLKNLGGSAWIQKTLDNLEGHKMLDTKTLTEEQQEQFIAGWEAAGGYTDDLEDSPAPWCCPWYHGNTKIEVEGDDPRAWGAQWWDQCKDEIEDELAAEESEEN